jgi:hypothetical protein
MTRFMKILTSVALAASLAPVAANATTTTSQNRIQLMMNRAVSGPLPVIQHVDRKFDALQAQTPLNQIIVQSGADVQLFPDSIGG